MPDVVISRSASDEATASVAGADEVLYIVLCLPSVSVVTASLLSGSDDNVADSVLTLSLALDLGDVGRTVWITSITSGFSVAVVSVVTIPFDSVITASLLSGRDDVVGIALALSLALDLPDVGESV